MTFPAKNEFIEAAKAARVLQEKARGVTEVSRKAYVIDVLDRAVETYRMLNLPITLALCTERLPGLLTAAIVDQAESCSERVVRMQNDTSILEEQYLAAAIDTLKAMVEEYNLILHHKLIVAVEG